jgi:hypothetical protein
VASFPGDLDLNRVFTTKKLQDEIESKLMLTQFFLIQGTMTGNLSAALKTAIFMATAIWF